MFMSHFNNVDGQTVDIYVLQHSSTDMDTTQYTLTADNVRMLCWKTVLNHMKRLLKKTFSFFKFVLFGTIASQIGQFYEKQ